MSYNWGKIFKKKSDQELYEIFLRNNDLGEDAKALAEKELKSRAFNFDKIDRYRKKWELEDLIEEERKDYKSQNTPDKNITGMILSAIFIIVACCDFIFKFTYEPNDSYTGIIKYVMLVVGIIALISSYKNYKKSKARAIYRKTRREQLIDELS